MHIFTSERHTMEIFQISKQNFGFDSKRYTAGFVLCSIVLPVLIMVGLLFQNSTFDLGRFFAGNAQNPAPLRYGSRSDSNEPAISPDGEMLNGTLDSRIHKGPGSRNVSSEPTSQPDDEVHFDGNSGIESFSPHDNNRNSSNEPASHPDNQGINGTSNPEESNKPGSRIDSSPPKNGKFLDRLFSPGLDERSCISRYESTLYRKSSTHKPSNYLLSKLREYENLHKHCGPATKSYNKALKKLAQNRTSKPTACKYIVWLPANGLGNRIISIAATFLYALLTNRVVLMDHRADMANLFCEPFPNTSWLLPSNFPLRNHHKVRYAKSLGSIVNMSMESPLSHLYLNLDHSDYVLDKKLFYYEKSQALLGKVPWVMIVSDQYFAPYFFMSQTYREEASKLFPEKDTVFYHLGRYLFNPTNQAWGLITRFYDAYLARADQRVGLQVRVYDPKTTPLQTVLDQLLLCTQKQQVLPEVETQKSADYQYRNKTSKAILVTSLYYEFYENLSHMYWTTPTVTGETIGVYQPSHEEFQHFGDNMHNMKAWAEIYLLSMTDVLVTSAWSTFGYVAQALGGLKPWILYKTDDKNIPNPPCRRDFSMEPCFHFPPTWDSHSKVITHLRHCVDFVRGVKMLSDLDQL